MYNEALDIAENKYPERFLKEGLLSWKLTTNARKSCLGLCDYNTREISLSRHHILAVDKKRVMNTILHEVAHAMCPQEGHSNVWKGVFKTIGGSGERVASRADVLKNNPNATPWKVINTATGETVASYYKKPRRDFSKCYVNGDVSTIGKLKLVNTKGE